MKHSIAIMLIKGHLKARGTAAKQIICIAMRKLILSMN